jgi:methylenetetrahydrofolate reductase (NADPH)
MPGALDAALGLPQGSVVTVTCSPSRGVAATIDLAEQLRACGYRVETHLAARRFESHAHLQDTVACLDTAGIGDVFVIGGDGDSSAGPFAGADLIAALAEIAPHLHSVGIPCYPEGHAAIGALLNEALDAKCFFAGHMVSQICFDADTIECWLVRTRDRGVALPVYIGLPGVIARRKLLGIALRIGLGDSTRVFEQEHRLLDRLALGAAAGSTARTQNHGGHL